MHRSFLIYFLVLALNATSQPQASGYPGSIVVEYGPGYSVEEESFNQNTLQIKVINRATNKIAAEYLRWNDSSFVYKGYDSSETLICTGMLKLNPQKTHDYILQIPDLEKDPDMTIGILKDTTLYEYYFDKHGLWEEVVSPYKKWEGEYYYNQKLGVWKLLSQQPCHDLLFRMDSIIVYENGIIIEPNYSLLSPDSLFSLLKGSWEMNWFTSGRYIRAFFHQQIESPYSSSYNFFTNSKVIYKQPYIENSKAYNCDWKFENNQLQISAENFNRKFKILFLSSDQLILKILE